MTKKAFTLAEVLITLAIIGVVAALTMPTLISNHQKHVLKTALQKSYSVLSVAYGKTAFDIYAGEPDCAYFYDGTQAGSGCMEFWGEFVKNLRVVKTCNGSALANGCVPEYTFNSNSGVLTPVRIHNDDTVYVLNDGVIVIPYIVNHLGGAPYAHAIVGFDTNGRKGPNKPGYDFFSVGIFYDKTLGQYHFAGNGKKGDTAWSNNSLNRMTVPADAPFRMITDVF